MKKPPRPSTSPLGLAWLVMPALALGACAPVPATAPSGAEPQTELAGLTRGASPSLPPCVPLPTPTPLPTPAPGASFVPIYVQEPDHLRLTLLERWITPAAIASEGNLEERLRSGLKYAYHLRLASHVPEGWCNMHQHTIAFVPYASPEAGPRFKLSLWDEPGAEGKERTIELTKAAGALAARDLKLSVDNADQPAGEIRNEADEQQRTLRYRAGSDQVQLHLEVPGDVLQDGIASFSATVREPYAEQYPKTSMRPVTLAWDHPEALSADEGAPKPLDEQLGAIWNALMPHSPGATLRVTVYLVSEQPIAMRLPIFTGTLPPEAKASDLSEVIKRWWKQTAPGAGHALLLDVETALPEVYSVRFSDIRLPLRLISDL